MKCVIAGLVVGLSVVAAAGNAYAQEGSPGPGKVEVTIIPAGWRFFQAHDNGPGFDNYDVGGAFAYNFTRMFGVEGEVGGSFGLTQDLDLRVPNTTIHETSPNMLSYVGNVVVNMPVSSVTPYVTGGAGGLTLYEREVVGINDSDTFFTSNVGAGVKWYAPNNRWGLRGDYRLQFVNSKDDAPEFFGQASRWGQRIYGGVVLNVIK